MVFCALHEAVVALGSAMTFLLKVIDSESACKGKIELLEIRGLK